MPNTACQTPLKFATFHEINARRLVPTSTSESLVSGARGCVDLWDYTETYNNLEKATLQFVSRVRKWEIIEVIEEIPLFSNLTNKLTEIRAVHVSEWPFFNVLD